LPYVSGQALEFDGLSVTLAGTPVPGKDVFKIEPSARSLSPFGVVDGLIADLELGDRTGAQAAQTVANGLRDLDSTLGVVMSTRAQLGWRMEQAEWTDDVLHGYRQHTLALGTDPDGEGELFATLVRTTDSIPSSSVVLAVHGYTDYFFNTELADHFAARGWRFYGLDSRRCGRSWREGQTPHFTTDLTQYDRELEGALAIIGAENPAARVLVYGHSTGGLVVSLWLDRVRCRGDTAAPRRH
jgi:predicted alpha/beta-fold hydrolase